jgi:hypothetical protein
VKQKALQNSKSVRALNLHLYLSVGVSALHAMALLVEAFVVSHPTTAPLTQQR